MSDAAPIGHNNPPPPTTADEWTVYLTERFAPQQARKELLLAAYERFLVAHQQIEDDDTAKKAADFRAQLQDLEKMAAAIHTQEKAPALLASRAIDGFLRDFKLPLTNASEVIRDRNTAYLRRKEDAIRQQRQKEAEEARQRAEAAAEQAMETMAPAELRAATIESINADDAAKRANAKASDLVRVTGDYGTTVTLKTTWKFDPETSDLMQLVKAVAEGKAPLYYLTFHTVRINVAVRTEKVRQIPGCSITEHKSS
jgi:hypothetical protein